MNKDIKIIKSTRMKIKELREAQQNALNALFDEFYEAPNKQKGENMERKVYKQVEVAKMIGVHRNSVYRWVRDGKIKSVLVAGVRMIPASEIEKLSREE